MLDSPRVFISYSWDSKQHRERVLDLACRLKNEGIDCRLDQDFQGLNSPDEGWVLWMLEQLEWSTFVLIVCTETYKQRLRRKEGFGKGKGVAWEGSIILQELYDVRVNSKKFIPVVFTPEDEEFIPIPSLRSITPCRLYTEEGYKMLRDYLKDQINITTHINQKPSSTNPLSGQQKVTVDQNKTFRQALIHVLRELDEEDIATICFSVLDSASEIRKLPKKQPAMSATFVNNLSLFDRLPELTSYLKKYHPHIMQQVMKYLE